MQLFLIVFVGFAFAVACLAVGVIMKREPLQGSCGGLNNLDGQEGSCSLCGAKARKRCAKKRAQTESS